MHRNAYTEKMAWRYIKPLSSENNIDAFENLTNFVFPEDFKNCVRKYNGARPEHQFFNTNKMSERALKSFLSFNREDRETMWEMYESCKAECGDKYIPFAIDNFGNLICFNRASQIVFVEHEGSDMEMVADSFEYFVNSLYKEKG